MCEECHRYPCHPQCPNAPGPVVVHSCINCGEDICDGDCFYDMDGEPWCEDCIHNRLKTAEQEESC